MLCFNCNQALGNVRDDPLGLYGLVDYLLAAGAGQARQPADEVHWADVAPDEPTFEVAAEFFRHAC
jgi:hypothetical protein